MTPAERSNPEILNGSRRTRIAKGSGTTIQEVNRLLKQFDQTRKMMKMVKYPIYQLFICGCLIIGLFPQLSGCGSKMREGLPAFLGCYNFMTSWIFIAILLVLIKQSGNDHHPRLSLPQTGTLEIHPESRGAMAGSICRISR